MFLLTFVLSAAHAEDGLTRTTLVEAPLPPPPARTTSPKAFDRPFAMASYGAVRAGTYSSAGVGGRARWEPGKTFGLDLYLEATVVDWEGGFRHDYPNGFSLYTALPVGPARIRPFAGFCDVLSFVEPTQPGAPRADDVMIGAHVGVGVELPITRAFSLFVDGQTDLYAAHDRSSGGWTGDVAEHLSPVWTGQVNAGIQLHLANPL